MTDQESAAEPSQESYEKTIQNLRFVSGYQAHAKDLVYEYVVSHLEVTDETKFDKDEIYVVWFAKTLQNWKALLSTTLPDGMYYEVTYDGEKRQAYLDAYKKFQNVCYPDPA